ncbi:MAG: 50S ribosomal protein L10 [Flavobacteriales bacterium]|jgi:large subunit ribosomal protein L10|nr:50S ribosomal protein L10 [Flavobacteriales bacterium]MBQ1968528.1 50S ribosomal protein L10 [Flavobacteriales bacterium]MBQ2421857.1 50S ribosomal protein L10 [Flavobacteriales bacterium]
MTREEKAQVIAGLTEELAAYNVIYLADISNLNAAGTEKLRRACFNAGVKLEVVKNALLAKAMEASEKDFQGLTETLKGSTALMLTEGAANGPGKVIKEYRKTSDRPILKGAWINEEVYVGDDQLNTLASIKSREELIGDIISLLQSPIRRVLSALENKDAQATEEAAE